MHADVPVELDVTDATVPGDAALAAVLPRRRVPGQRRKYAGATSVRVRVAVEGGELHVAVSDDGAGGADAGAGTGLRGLQDRMDALGGTLCVESPPGGGTRVSAVVPFGDR